MAWDIGRGRKSGGFCPFPNCVWLYSRTILVALLILSYFYLFILPIAFFFSHANQNINFPSRNRLPFSLYFLSFLFSPILSLLMKYQIENLQKLVGLFGCLLNALQKRNSILTHFKLVNVLTKLTKFSRHNFPKFSIFFVVEYFLSQFFEFSIFINFNCSIFLFFEIFIIRNCNFSKLQFLNVSFV